MKPIKEKHLSIAKVNLGERFRALGLGSRLDLNPITKQEPC